MKLIGLVVTLLLCVGCCTISQSDSKKNQNIESVYNLMNDNEIIDVDHIKNIELVNLGFHEYTGLVYFTDADCSMCIRSMFDFLSFLKENGIVCDVTIVVEEGRLSIVNFYRKNCNLDWNENWNLLECKDLGKESFESVSGTILFMSNNVEVRCALYVG